jgi:hypothetical protein
VSRSRPLREVPRIVFACVAAALPLQLLSHAAVPSPQARAEDLSVPPSAAVFRAASFGEPIAVAKWLMLSLQGYDNQPGIDIPFVRLDYVRVIAWLDRILALDPDGQYPLLSASRLYAEAPDPSRQRQMLDFIYGKFLEDPDRRWPWLAHAAMIARHRLNDLPLARTYAQALRMQATGPDVPHWAQQMEILLLADMNEAEAAKVLLGGLLTSGKVTDPHELHFLTERLKGLETSAEQPSPAGRK